MDVTTTKKVRLNSDELMKALISHLGLESEVVDGKVRFEIEDELKVDSKGAKREFKGIIISYEIKSV